MENILRYKTGLLALLVLLVTGCKELDLAPENAFTDLTFWSSEAKAHTVLNTAYSQMSRSSYFFYNEALSDNAVVTRGDNAGATSIASGTYDAALGRINEEWDSHYSGIKTTNIFLENVEKVPNIEEESLNQMKAEARFIRAFLHFQLMTWFGDIPLLNGDISVEEAQVIKPTPRAEVLSFITNELDEIVPFLPTNTEVPIAEKGTITKGAAIALKARVLLYEGDWAGVVTATETLINSNEYGDYGLFTSGEDPYEGLFLPENENNQEVILALEYVPELRTWGEFFDIAPISAGARLNALAPTQELVDSYLTLSGLPIDDPSSGYVEDDPYVNRDPRLTYTVVYHGYEWENPDGSTQIIYIEPGSDPDDNTPNEYNPGSSATGTGYYTRKYFDPTHSTGLSSGLDLILIRHADVLLMYAEAKNELGQFDEAIWNQTIRPIRERAGFTDQAALNYDASLGQEGLREVIRNERRVELAMEGLRIFDIRRWEIAEDVLNGWVHGAQFGPANVDDGYIQVQLRSFDPAKHYLWPVPRDERAINPNLTQNPNW